MKRGDVYWAGDRPVIVVSHDGFNQAAGWQSVSVVPVSTWQGWGRRSPTVVALPEGSEGLPRSSMAICHQVTTLDRARLTKRAGELSEEMLREVEGGIRAAMDLE